MDTECGPSSTAAVRSPRDALREKISATYDTYHSGWLKSSTMELIGIAEEIYTITQMAARICDVISDADAEYLLRFDNPLKVVSDYWSNLGIMNSHLIAGEMRHMVWDIRSRGDAETGCDLAGDRMENSMEEMT